MSSGVRGSLLPTAAFALLVPFVPFVAFAQEQAATTTAAVKDALTEVLVTANRREESLQKVDVSATVETAVELQEVNIHRPEDLSRLVPGLTAIPNAGSAATSYAIRGVGQADFTEHEEQPVAVYQDGVYIANSAGTGFPMFDVQRAEVLRGPQGTLFGKNATAGLIQILSNQPSAGSSGSISGTEGDRSLHRIEGFLNEGDATIAERLAFYFHDKDGFVKNTEGRNLLAESVWALRSQTRYNFNESTTATLRFEAWNSNGTSDAGQDAPSYYNPITHYPVPFPNSTCNCLGTGPGNNLYGYQDPNTNPLVRSVNDPGAIIKRGRTAALKLSHELSDDLTLYSVSSFVESTVYYREDTDGSILHVFDYHDGGTSDTLAQELRLEKAAGTVRWTGGLNFLNVHGNYNTHTDVPTICDPTDTVSCSYAPNVFSLGGNAPLNDVTGRGAYSETHYGLGTRSAGAFSQGEWDFADKWTAILGVRYSSDWQKFNYLFNCVQTLAGACQAIFGYGTNPNVASVGLLGNQRLSQSHRDWSGKVGLNYNVTNDMLLYTTLSKGLKSAGYFSDTSGFAPASSLAFKPEELYAYETGMKSSFFGRRLIVNADVYYYDYHDFQTFSFNGVVTSVINKPALARGSEVELTAQPGAGVTAYVGLAYNNMWVKDVVIPYTGETKDQRSINAPLWQLNWNLSKRINLPNDEQLTLAYNGRYTSARQWSVVNQATSYSGPVTTHDLNARLQVNEKVSISALCTNVANKIYPNIVFDQTAQGFYLKHYAEPRTFALSASYDF